MLTVSKQQSIISFSVVREILPENLRDVKTDLHCSMDDHNEDNEVVTIIPHRYAKHKMRPIVTVCVGVCVSVCLLVTTKSSIRKRLKRSRYYLGHGL